MVKRKMNGKGFFGDIWNWTKGAAGTVNNFLKKTKAVSTIAKLIPDARAKAIGEIANQAGYGKKGKGKKSMKGKGKKPKRKVINA